MPILAFSYGSGSATGSSTAWITVAVAAGTFVLTASLTLLVQLYIAPRVETRKRREDRWERYVLELGELLTTTVSRLAHEAQLAQSTSRFLDQGLEGVSDVDEDKLERERREQRWKAYQATEDFHDLVTTRVEWLVDRIRSFDPKAKIIGEFDMAARRHWLYAMVEFVPEHDSRTEDVFDSEWKQDREARRALINQVKRLADLPHPPRASRLGSAENWAGLLGGPDPAGGT